MAKCYANCNPRILQYHESVEPPKFRPLERFWPYADLPEQPTDEELASLDPDLHEALFGADAAAVLDHARVSGARRAGLSRARSSWRARRPSSARPGAARAIAIARASGRADAERLRDLFEIVGRSDATEVLIDDRPVPYARELWLPLVWFLIPR